MFHANPWDHVRIDPATGLLIRHRNPYPTPESLYDLCDPEHVYETFRNDFVVRLLVGFQSGDLPFLEQHEQLASTLDVQLDLAAAEARVRSGRALYDACAFRASTLLLDEMQRRLRADGKHLLVLLSYAAPAVTAACRNEPRADAAFLDALAGSGIPYVDTLAHHVEDFGAFAVDAAAYADRYFNGHYSPIGSHFFAFAVKDALVSWLDPRPPAYRDPERSFAVQAGRLT